ncbi:uncharacterized protein LOC143445498 isoform X1 [Clavelina lepadiformis]|uniref:WxxW domain-containing protein n=1 Tax=Clavelina lepadiformis TaxID=159417 RepID=A0ABP0GSG0_CLALP
MVFGRSFEIGIIFFSLLLSATHETYTEDKLFKQKSMDDLEAEFSECTCDWSQWMNNDDYSPFTGDNNTFTNLRRIYSFCSFPTAIECRDAWNPDIPFALIQQDRVLCDPSEGLLCDTENLQKRPENSRRNLYCHDYELRVWCCDCPETTTPPTTTMEQTSEYSNLSYSDSVPPADLLHNNTDDTQVVKKNLDYVLPLSIIAVIILGAVILFVLIVCIILNARGRKRSKYSHDYMEVRENKSGATYTQRPVSFTDFDRRGSSDSSSSLSVSSSGVSSPSSKLTQLERGKLQFVPTDHGADPDVIPIPIHAADAIDHIPEQRRWLPDEYERSLEKQGAKDVKKSIFTRSFPPANKGIQFVDSACVSADAN